MRSDLLVVGAGLFGSVIGRYAQSLGLSVRWVDSADPRSASKASAGLFKPDWLSALGRDRTKVAMGVLEQLAPPTQVTFNTALGKVLTLDCIAPHRLLAPKGQVTTGVVNLVRPGRVVLLGGEELEADRIVVAAGVGVNDIVGTKVDVTAKVGAAFRWVRHAHYDRDNRFAVWAPYKQTMVFDLGDGTMWGGDGTALKPSSMTTERQAESARRVGKLAGWQDRDKPVVVHTLVGHRPFVEGHKGGLLTEVQTDVYVATGGGKIGTVAAGAFAQEWAQLAGVV